MDMGLPILRIVHDADLARTQEPKASDHALVDGEGVASSSHPAEPCSVLRLEDFATERLARAPESHDRPTHDHDDGELVRRLLTGDRAAFEQLYRRHAQFAFKLAVRLQGSAHDIEDIVHDAFLKAQARIGSLLDPGSFRGWLGSIVVNEVRLRMRRGRLLRALRLQSADPVDLDSLASEAASPEVRAQLAQVYGMLRLMATEERIAWTLRFVERHQLEEVAELTGCSLATVKRRLLAAQRFLAEHLVTDSRQRPEFEAAKRGVV